MGIIIENFHKNFYYLIYISTIPKIMFKNFQAQKIMVESLSHSIRRAISGHMSDVLFYDHSGLFIEVSDHITDRLNDCQRLRRVVRVLQFAVYHVSTPFRVVGFGFFGVTLSASLFIGLLIGSLNRRNTQFGNTWTTFTTILRWFPIHQI